MFLIDSHCHLNCLKDEKNEDINIIVDEAKKAGVGIINNICTSLNEFDDILAVANLFENVFCSIGHHPEYAENKIRIDDILNKKSDKIIGIGEAGLDYHFVQDNKDKQKYNFEVQIEAARQTKLPLIIHSRDADDDMIDILETEMKNGEFRFLLHCFSSGKKLAYKGLDLGGYLSFSGILTFKNAVELQEIAKDVPLDKILLETDSPYLAPVPYRGQVNKPAYVYKVAAFLAELRDKTIEEIAKITTKNCFDVFAYKQLNIQNLS